MDETTLIYCSEPYWVYEWSVAKSCIVRQTSKGRYNPGVFVDGDKAGRQKVVSVSWSMSGL